MAQTNGGSVGSDKAVQDGPLLGWSGGKPCVAGSGEPHAPVVPLPKSLTCRPAKCREPACGSSSIAGEAGQLNHCVNHRVNQCVNHRDEASALPANRFI